MRFFFLSVIIFPSIAVLLYYTYSKYKNINLFICKKKKGLQINCFFFFCEQDTFFQKH